MDQVEDLWTNSRIILVGGELIIHGEVHTIAEPVPVPPDDPAPISTAEALVRRSYGERYGDPAAYWRRFTAALPETKPKIQIIPPEGIN